MQTSRTTAQRILSLVLISLAIALTSTALFTNHWHEEVSQSRRVVFHRGLWTECHVFLGDTDISKEILFNKSNNSTSSDETQTSVKITCQKMEVVTRDILVARGLLSICIAILSLGVLVPVILCPFKGRLNMDISSTAAFVGIILKVGALALYYDVNRVHTDLNFRYTMGYSYMVAWLSFSLLIFATTLSILSRKDEEHVNFSKCEELSCRSLTFNENITSNFQQDTEA